MINLFIFLQLEVQWLVMMIINYASLHQVKIKKVVKILRKILNRVKIKAYNLLKKKII